MMTELHLLFLGSREQQSSGLSQRLFPREVPTLSSPSGMAQGLWRSIGDGTVVDRVVPTVIDDAAADVRCCYRVQVAAAVAVIVPGGGTAEAELEPVVFVHDATRALSELSVGGSLVDRYRGIGLCPDADRKDGCD